MPDKEIRNVVEKIFYSPATNGKAEQSINEGVEAVQKLLESARYHQSPQPVSPGWVKEKDNPATILKSYFVITPKGDKAIGILLDPTLYYDGQKRRWMVNGSYYNAEVEYYLDESAI